MDIEKVYIWFIEKFSLFFFLIVDIEWKMIDVFKVWGLKKFMGCEYDGIYWIMFIINEKGVIIYIIDKLKMKIYGEEILNLEWLEDCK